MTESRIGAKELLLIFAFWTFIATLSAANRLLDPRGFGFRLASPAAPVALEYMEAWIWAAVTPLVFWLSSRYAVERSNWPRRVLLLLFAGFAIAIVADLIFELIRFEILARPPRFGFSPWRQIARFRFVNQLLVYLAILAAGFARNYYIRYQRRQQETAELRAQLADARLDALRMQINPHFLFNTLHAISALVDRDPAGVRRMIARLSELLRHTIDERGSDEVPLRDELDFLRRYIEIMEIRFQGRLRVTMSIDEGVLDALVPNLILQPIVENALEHGAARMTGEGRVEIAARRRGDDVVMSVQDNGPGLRDAESKGVGLRNTEARLEQLYGDAASLSLRSVDGGGVLAQIVLPFHTARDLKTYGV
ncbi:MAG TPA: sensor histidine kinase [Thermoanaerobaculia bacterium]|jgi:signal transduction histidine kinase|nr:sensor histidine kinase [Thermoanaerobaculia bacterium]